MIERPCRQCGRTIQCLRKDKTFCNHICRAQWHRAGVPALAMLERFAEGGWREAADRGSEPFTRSHSEIHALRPVAVGGRAGDATCVGLPHEVFYPDITLPPTGGECPRTDTPDGAAK